MNKKDRIFRVVMMGILTALVIVLQLIGGISIGPFSITLTLVPIVAGAILLGWQCGTILGVVFGVIVSVLSITGKDPGGFMVFQANAALGWVVCILKGAAAGFLPAVIYKSFSAKKHAPHVFMALSGAFLVLGGFAVGRMVTFEQPWQTTVFVLAIAVLAAGYLLLARYALASGSAAVYLAAMVAPIANTGIFIAGMLLFFREVLASWAGGTDLYLFLLTAIVGINFVLEFTVSLFLAPAIATIVKAVRKSKRSE